MSTDPQAATVALAEERAAAARQRLGDSFATLQARLNPRVVARDAVENLQESGEKALRTGVQSARAHPDRVIWAVALAIAWLTRRQIVAALTRKRPHDAETAAQLARSIPGDWPQSAERKNR